MSFFSRNTNYLTFNFRNHQDMTSIIEYLKDSPVKNIIGKKDYINVGYEGFNSINKEDFSVFEDKFIGFTEVCTEKNIPMDVVKAKVEYIRQNDPQYRGFSKKDFKSNYAQDIKNEIIEEMTPFASTKQTRTDMIIDLKNKRIHVKPSKRKLICVNRLEVKNILEDVYIPSRFSRNLMVQVMNPVFLNELFIYWLYNKSASGEFKDGLSLKNKIQMKDSNTSVSISGNVENFIDIYNKLSQAQIKDVSLQLDKEENNSDMNRTLYTFTLNRDTTEVKGFYSHNFSRGKKNEVLVSNLMSRIQTIDELNLYIAKIVHNFEEEIKGQNLENLIQELRFK